MRQKLNLALKVTVAVAELPSKYLTPPAPAKPRSALIEADERAEAQSDIQIEILVLIVLMIMAPGISPDKILRH